MSCDGKDLDLINGVIGTHFCRVFLRTFSSCDCGLSKFEISTRSVRTMTSASRFPASEWDNELIMLKPAFCHPLVHYSGTMNLFSEDLLVKLKREKLSEHFA